MGTKVHCQNYFQGFNSMRDLNEDSSSNSWPTSCGDKAMTNGQQCYNGVVSRTMIDCHPFHDRDAMKQKMLKHETVFRSQLYELHRLYRIQKDMMEEVRRKELHRFRFSTEPSSSSSLCGYQLTSGEVEKMLPLFNSSYARASASGVETGNSPMSCTKEYNTGPSRLPFLNGPSLKESDSDSRPSKVRKKMFDLQLPADRYTDAEERGKLLENNVNEPIPIEEETVVPSSINFLGRGSAVYGDTYVAVNEENTNFPHTHEAGSSRRNLFIQGKGSTSIYTMASILNPIHHKPSMHHHNLLSSSDQSHEQSNNGHLVDCYPVASRTHGSYPFFTSSCFSNSCSSHSMPASSVSHKRAIFDSSSNSVATADRAQSQVPFGGNWNIDSSSRLCPNLAGELTARNGFYHGSTSRTQEAQLCPTSYGLGLNSNRGSNSCHEDKKQTIDIDLNEVAEDERDNEEDHLSSLPWLKDKPSHTKEAAKDEFPGDKSIHHSSSNQSWCKNETVKDPDLRGIPQPSVLTSLETKMVEKVLGVPIFQTNASENDRSCILPTSESVSFHVVGHDEHKKRIIDINLECEPVDDDVADVEEPALVTNVRVVKNQIDLNSCVSDSEDPYVPSLESKTATVRRILEIDLEAPPLQESEDDLAAPLKENIKDEFSLQSPENKNIPTHDEFLQDAAQIIFSISSFCPQTRVEDKVNQPSEESLHWFVDIVSSYSNELENANNNDDSLGKESSEEIDDFEAMTLQLPEMKEEEDYLPRPFIPEIQEIEERETNNSLPSRSRRGHSRRGRQRKDFQRDILPGVAALSRHKVTEDLQTFGGIMRAMGHLWNSGLTRRNGGTRGRRRAAIVETVLNVVAQSQVCAAPSVQKLSSGFERGLEDRSLTGWGKTTRRPRRQRCHAGNNTVTAVLT